MYLGTYISTHYTLTIGDDKAYFEKNSSPKIVKLHRINMIRSVFSNWLR